MARQLKFPVRRHTRLTEHTDKQLKKRAKKLKVPVGVAMRLSVEHSLAQGDAVKKPGTE